MSPLHFTGAKDQEADFIPLKAAHESLAESLSHPLYYRLDQAFTKAKTVHSLARAIGVSFALSGGQNVQQSHFLILNWLLWRGHMW
jgi:hypothetical protein